jgi:hypothetical protein
LKGWTYGQADNESGIGDQGQACCHLNRRSYRL